MPETGKSSSRGEPQNNDGAEEAQRLAAELESTRGKLSEAEKKAMTFDALDKRYRSDDKFRAAFDREWYGKGQEAAQEQNLSAEEHLRKELHDTRESVKRLESHMEGLKDVYVNDKVMGGRNGLNVRYEEEFQRLASDVGYDPGTEAYEVLFDNTIRAGYDVARKFGMLNQAGQPDPLAKYNDVFMKEAFNKAFDKHKKAGFDTAWKRKQDALNIEKERSKPNEMDRFFSKDKLKTVSDRARALEKAFRWKTRGQNLKMV